MEYTIMSDMPDQLPIINFDDINPHEIKGVRFFFIEYYNGDEHVTVISEDGKKLLKLDEILYLTIISSAQITQSNSRYYIENADVLAGYASNNSVIILSMPA